MRKLAENLRIVATVAMVLVVILGVVPGVADQADYLGTWVNTMEHATKDGVTVMVFVLAEEGVCYFSTQSFDKVKGEPRPGAGLHRLLV